MKNSFTQTLYKNRATLCALLIMLCGVLVRVVNFGTTPTGFNQDEAFAGYEAFSLLHYGVDSWGYHNPCYFVSWGSGMNVLQSYLAIPFIKLLGCSITAVRLPQLLLACLSLPVFYLLMKNVFSTRAALTGLFLLAISPWHIMLSRWGLESNLAPAFLLLGLYFFIKGIENNRYWLASGVMYGLSLYAYSITWLVVPVTIVLWVLYLLLSKQKFSFTYLLLFGAILFVFALPQMLFLLVNKGFISEIVTPFISIPKLTVMRGAEISLKNLFSPDTYKNFIDVFIRQNDGLPWNATESFGLFYKISLPFIAFGAIKLLKTAWISAKSKIFCRETIIILGMLSSIFT
ncbi:MAG: glycosyltransferase family 39 protein, partial [Oscillospiraceae bacterium]